MYLTSAKRAQELGQATVLDDDARQGALISAALCGAEGGEVGFLEIPPGSSHATRPCAVEAAAVLVRGDGTVTTSAGSLAGPGAVAFLPAGARLHVESRTEWVSLLTLFGGTVEWTDADYHRDGDDGGVCFAVAEQVDHPFHIPDMGFFDMSARWLVDGESRGSRSLTLGQSTFAPGTGVHALHRHPNAEEIFYVWEGSAVHLTEHGEHPMDEGDIVFVPRNEWHGVRNTGSAPLKAVFGYLGVNSLDAGGYELPASG